MRRTTTIALPLLLGLLACRATGSRDRTPPPAAAEPAATATPAATAGQFAFPLSPASPTALRAVPAFPSLSFDRPVFLTAAPHDPDHLYVVEQAGRVLRFDNRPDVATTQVVLDIRERVRTQHNEEGLLGLAFDPAFANGGHVYVYYSASQPRRTQVSRFTAKSGGVIEPASEREILRIEQPYGNHNGGMLAFGPDGMLYLGVGDGGAADDPHGHGQNLGTLLASILRLRVGPAIPTYQIPSDNPFVTTAGARAEIWAYGLRNPWRFSFDRQTGALWVGDVGQDTLEEVDLVTRGGNYGWNAREGTRPFARRDRPADMIDPVTEYGRHEGESITGGYVYRGTKLSDFRGMYLLGDYVTGQVWAIDPASADASARTRVASVPALASFGEDAAGELYALSFDGNAYRFEAADAAVAGRHFPTKLSQTGLFSDLSKLTAAPGLLPYDLALPFWSDGASKQRWLAMPAGGTIEVSDDEAWRFPVGTITVKHFELPLDDGGDDPRTRRLETRVMVHEQLGWSGYSYRWNDAGTDATLVTAPTRESYPVVRDGAQVNWAWEYPAGSECLRCHTPGYGQVMGIRTRQVAGQTAFLAALTEAGHLPAGAIARAKPHPALDDTTAPIDTRARAYLDVNCAPCHHPGGPAPGSIDMRVQTAWVDTHLPSVPPEERLGLAGELRVSPGDAAHSSVWLRMSRRGKAGAMPPLSSAHVDDTGATLLAAWINAMATGT
jgi:uncharacterized repeat protein (TIGR03806 family)